MNCGTRRKDLRGKSSHHGFGHVEVEMVVKYLSENRHMDPHFRRGSGLDLKALD